jgi:hypothetical protein
VKRKINVGLTVKTDSIEKFKNLNVGGSGGSFP